PPVPVVCCSTAAFAKGQRFATLAKANPKKSGFPGYAPYVWENNRSKRHALTPMRRPKELRPGGFSVFEPMRCLHSFLRGLRPDMPSTLRKNSMILTGFEI